PPRPHTSTLFPYTTLFRSSASIFHKETSMKLRNVVLASALLAAAAAAFAQAKEQFIPVLSYRTGPYAPNGTPWANGYVDYIKLVDRKSTRLNSSHVAISYA